MRLIAPFPKRLGIASFSNGFLNNNIIPDCFRICTNQDAKKDLLDDPECRAKMEPVTDFHSLSASGYNGLLAKGTERRKAPDALIEIHNMIKKANVGRNLMTYNYMIKAYMKAENYAEAYRMIFEMEAFGIKPDVMTFEALMVAFDKMRGMGPMVEDLFELMQARYGLTPSLPCWVYKIFATYEREGRSLIDVYEKMCEANPHARFHARTHSDIFHQALVRKRWTILNHILPKFRSTDNPNGIPLYKSTVDMAWERQSAFANERSIQLVRYLAKHHNPANEESAMKLLMYASKIGLPAADLAETAILNLIRVYRNAETGKVDLPKFVLEAYIKALTPTDNEYIPLEEQTSSLTEAMRAKLSLFTKALEPKVEI